MGYVHAEIVLRNPRKPDLRPIQAVAMADTGSLMLCIPSHIALQLELQQSSMREVTTADGGANHTVPYVGPVEVIFENRQCFVGALVLGDEVLLGAVPMEDMDLVISPSRRTITVNPQSPNLPHALVK